MIASFTEQVRKNHERAFYALGNCQNPVSTQPAVTSKKDGQTTWLCVSEVFIPPASKQFSQKQRRGKTRNQLLYLHAAAVLQSSTPYLEMLLMPSFQRLGGSAASLIMATVFSSLAKRSSIRMIGCARGASLDFLEDAFKTT